MLREGLLWLDDTSKRSVAAKLNAAIAHYERRFGHCPTLAHLHPAQVAGLNYERLHIVADASVRQNHFLIGVHDWEAEEITAHAGKLSNQNL